MEDTKKTPAELVADLMLDPGFVLVPQDRYEELVRAETERDVLEATIKGENSYNVDRVLAAIQRARKAAWLKVSAAALNAEGAPEAGNDAEYPDEIAQVEADARASVDHTEAVNTAIQAERARMQEIDEISGLLDATDVQQAKYGDKPCSAADLLMAAAKNAAKQGKKFLTDLKDDSEESGAEGVPAAPAPAVETPEGEDGEKNDTPEARMTNARSMVADLLGKKKEG